ncbi:UDP-N-acetylglucosamine 2-epimerase (non-hydrolyzing) [Sphingomonas sp. RB56-2]|uniref:UDP-N-acetylglucosamine 2-epimerase (non-hydrolyzing) n=1 Tax=Sphingomonas brevis TaxID=2908206 RepID=A0ABT0S9A3_9SPHN|nr:UDP-N-acetylglucosamine 2-epimerase (non-hydrolyzing) [Sphingomonas brevis]MCL6740985.1 UDP-N-acetylglucosamine 2-epimerase (non-hydrolyzing) [Sphingomonas brevis]
MAWATIDAPKPGGKLRQYRIAFVVGTRPEAIKLSPVAHALAALGEPPHLFVTGQHPGLELSDHRLEGFTATLLDCPGQPDPMLHSELVRGALKRLLPLDPPDLLIVQGDTSSALGGALAARETGVPLAHVEAGLRSHDPNLPWPEEENRVAIDRLADLLFAPTSGNAANLRRDKVAGEVTITGNSGIDVLAELVGPLPLKPQRRWWPRSHFKLLVTCHRRENWGSGLDRLAKAIRVLAEHNIHCEMLLPPNPKVTERMTALLGDAPNVKLIAPLSHFAMIDAMRRADLVLSDSGGIQEEAPALGVPLLVLRDKTERPEGLTSGSMELVGTDPERIVEAVMRLRRDRAALRAMARPCLPFGDGRAAPRIARHCLTFLEDRIEPADSLTA